MASDPYRVNVTGGDEAGRQLLTATVAALLKKEGFTGVTALTQDNEVITPNRMMAATVAEIVTTTRPDLFKSNITVQSQKPLPPPPPADTSKLYLSVENENGISISDTRGDIADFAYAVEMFDLDPVIQVESRSEERVGQAVASLLLNLPNAKIQASLRTSLDAEGKMMVGRF